MHFSLTLFRKLLLGDFLESWVNNKEGEDKNEEVEGEERAIRFVGKHLR